MVANSISLLDELDIKSISGIKEFIGGKNSLMESAKLFIKDLSFDGSDFDRVVAEMIVKNDIDMIDKVFAEYKKTMKQYSEIEDIHILTLNSLQLIFTNKFVTPNIGIRNLFRLI